MSGNLYIGPGITFGAGITVSVLPASSEWDFSGDLMLQSGVVDIQTESGSVDLN